MTVWVIRPAIKRIPTPAQQRGMRLTLTDPRDAGRFKSDAALLSWMQKHNPRFEIPSLRGKVSATIPADTPMKPSLPPGLTLQLTVDRSGHEVFMRALSKMTAGSKPEMRRKLEQIAREGLVLRLASTTKGPSTDIYGYQPGAPGSGRGAITRVGGSSGGGSTQTGVFAVMPGCVFIVDNSAGFTTNYQVQAGPVPGKTKVVTKQDARDIVLASVEQLRQSKGAPSR